jgi:hypothetical protein
MRSMLLALATLLLTTGTASAGAECSLGELAAPPYCVGDCDRSGDVEVAEVIRAVRIALREVDQDRCAAADASGDDRTSVDELVAAVNAALIGCTLPPAQFDSRLGVNLRAAAGAVNLSLITGQHFPCAGYRLRTALHIDGDRIVAVLGCVLPPPGVCLTIVAPATFDTRLPLAPGVYTLELHAVHAIDTYRVDYSGDAIDVTPIDTLFSALTI